MLQGCLLYTSHAQLNIVPKNDGLKEYTVTNAHPMHVQGLSRKGSETPLLHVRQAVIGAVSYTHLPPFLTENFLVIELDGVDTLVLLAGGYVLDVYKRQT